MAYVTSQRGPEREPHWIYQRDPELRRKMLISRVGIIKDLRPDLLEDPAALTVPPEPNIAAASTGYGPYGYDTVLLTRYRLASEIAATEQEIRDVIEELRDEPTFEEWLAAKQG